MTAAEQFFMMATKCTNGDKPTRFFIQLLLTFRDVSCIVVPRIFDYLRTVSESCYTLAIFIPLPINQQTLQQ